MVRTGRSRGSQLMLALHNGITQEGPAQIASGHCGRRLPPAHGTDTHKNNTSSVEPCQPPLFLALGQEPLVEQGLASARTASAPRTNVPSILQQ